MKIKDMFEGYLEYRRQSGAHPKTLSSDKTILYGSFAHSISELDLDSLKLVDVADVMVSGRAHGEYGPQRSVTTLRKYMKYLKDLGNPMPFDWEDIEIPNVPRKMNEYLTVEELKKVFDSFDLDTLQGLRERALCELLLASGMRISEALSLDKADIDWEKKEASITNAKTKDREPVQFTDRSLSWLKRYLDARKDDHPYLFVSGKGRMLTMTARWYLRTHTAKLGIKKHIKNHIFRKSFATHLLQQGVDIKTVQVLARHKDPRTTLRYYAAVNKERSRDVYSEIMNGTLKAYDGPARKIMKIKT